MPIYEYKCLSCDSHFEKMQKASDAPFKTCEKCGGALEKQWSLSGFQFKGAGWYVTDYAGKTKETSAEKSEKSEKTEKAEKSSAVESTARTESASKPVSDTAASSKKESVSKKD
jgi:putative FmdB family regulatory protein